MSAKRLTRNELLMRISSEMSALAVFIPTNPMDVAALARNARTAEIRLGQLAQVVSSMVPSYNYGGIDEANEQYRDYMAKLHPEGTKQEGG